MIQTSSRRLRLAAQICRFLPPALTGGRLVAPLYSNQRARRENAGFERRSSLTDITFSYDRADYIATRFAVRGYYEWRNLVIANVVCEPGDTIVEIGANIGTETMLFARVVGARGQVIAFEPVPSNFATLRRLREVNHLENLEIVQAAVSETPGVMHFATVEDEFTSGEGRLIDTTDAADTGHTLQVETVTLDGWLGERSIKPPTLVCSDTEGAELFVLRGMTQLIGEHRPALILENEPRLLAQHHLTPDDVASLLEDSDYALFDYSRSGLSPLTKRETPGNWLALPRDTPTVATRIHTALRRSAWLPPIRGLSPVMLPRSTD